MTPRSLLFFSSFTVFTLTNFLSLGCTGSWSPQPTLVEYEESKSASPTHSSSNQLDLKTTTPLSPLLGQSATPREGKAKEFKDYLQALKNKETLVDIVLEIPNVSFKPNQIQCTLLAHELNAYFLESLHQRSLKLQKLYGRLWASFIPPWIQPGSSESSSSSVSSTLPSSLTLPSPLHPRKLIAGDLIYLPHPSTEDEILLVEKPLTWLKETAYLLGSCTPLSTLSSLTRQPVHLQNQPLQALSLKIKSTQWSIK